MALPKSSLKKAREKRLRDAELEKVRQTATEWSKCTAGQQDAIKSALWNRFARDFKMVKEPVTATAIAEVLGENNTRTK